MTPGIHCCSEDDDLAKAVRHMEALKIRRLPVINKSKRMVGILSLGDVSHSASTDLLSECIKNVFGPSQLKAWRAERLGFRELLAERGPSSAKPS